MALWSPRVTGKALRDRASSKDALSMKTNFLLVLLVSKHVPDRAMADSDMAELVGEPSVVDTCFRTLRESGSVVGYKQLGLSFAGRRRKGEAI